MDYSLIKPLLFCLSPEAAHSFTLKTLSLAHRFNYLAKHFPKISAPRTVMGLSFENGVGLAAGLDKDGEYIDALAELGFGSIEVGTITPHPQEGNPKPRLFRLTHQEAIINRMGFNSKGLEYFISQLKRTKFRGVLGINIGKNRDTPIEQAEEDYISAFHQVAHYASYITINISSPNTAGLRDLQGGELLSSLLKKLKAEQLTFFLLNAKYIPLVVKIAPDLTPEELSVMAETFLKHEIDGIIATNTTLSRDGVVDSPFAKEAGGLSGKPMRNKSTDVIKNLFKIVGEKIPIIASGGIFSAADAQEKMEAGAKLVQIYSGLIYRGPQLINDIARAI